MLVVFLPLYMADTKAIFGCNFEAPFEYLRCQWSPNIISKAVENYSYLQCVHIKSMQERSPLRSVVIQF